MITDTQRDHMMHALGLNQVGAKRAYRNRFWTDVDGQDGTDWGALVSAGLAVVSPPRAAYGGMVCFSVTDAGLDALGVVDRSGLDARERFPAKTSLEKEEPQ